MSCVLMIAFLSVIVVAQRTSKDPEVFARIVSCEICSRQIIVLPKPEYPKAGTFRNLFGSVHVEILIGTDGYVVSAKAISGPPLLRQNSEKAALRARFEPIMLNGKPVRAKTMIVYNFIR
jgi:outer membrane biosynthesis protein TonB